MGKDEAVEDRFRAGVEQGRQETVRQMCEFLGSLYCYGERVSEAHVEAVQNRFGGGQGQETDGGQLAKVRQELQRHVEQIKWWLEMNKGKQLYCGCAPMHNDGPCLEHQTLPELEQLLQRLPQ